MKKSVLLILISLISTLSAQEFKGFLIPGLSFSQVDGDQVGGFNKISPFFGLGVERELENDFSVRFSANYIRKGSRSTTKNLVWVRFRFNYLEFPLQIQYQITDKYGVSAGIFYARLIGAKQDDGSGYKDISPLLLKGDAGIEPRFVYTLNDRTSFEMSYAFSVVSIRQNFYLRNRSLKAGLIFFLGS